jgi:hypothetical protein
MSKLKNTPKQKTLSIGDGQVIAERVAAKIVEKATPTHSLLDEIDLIDVECHRQCKNDPLTIK